MHCYLINPHDNSIISTTEPLERAPVGYSADLPYGCYWVQAVDELDHPTFNPKETKSANLILKCVADRPHRIFPVT